MTNAGSVSTLLPVVAAALADGSGKVLVQQRPPGKEHAGLWEFPGGKIEAGESPEAALVRELAEELGIEVADADLTPIGFASRPAEDRHLVLLLFAVDRWQGELQALDAAAIAWVDPAMLQTLPMPPADIALAARMIPRPSPAS